VADRVLEAPAPAKLNRFLHLVGRRDDGYHLLQTVFQIIDVADTIRVEAAPAGCVEFLPGSDAPGGDDDLTLGAARALARVAGVRAGARIHLTKRLPAGGGLGGGSSDAATVLLALNRLWSLDLALDELAVIGLGLGADVPVFVHGRTAWAEGVGERLSPIATPAETFVILRPRVHVETARVFAHPELTRDTPISKMPAAFDRGGHNDCAPVVRALYPEVDRALAWLEARGEARLTGTGACVFLPCADAASAERIAAEAPEDVDVLVAGALARSPAHARLGYD
jgi:4-diphosphocytidyl-2-C-methyl-D-erythritol kinase